MVILSQLPVEASEFQRQLALSSTVFRGFKLEICHSNQWTIITTQYCFCPWKLEIPYALTKFKVSSLLHITPTSSYSDYIYRIQYYTFLYTVRQLLFHNYLCYIYCYVSYCAVPHNIRLITTHTAKLTDMDPVHAGVMSTLYVLLSMTLWIK